MQELWKYLKTADKPIVLYGMGDGADKIINVLSFNGIKVSGLFVSDGFVRDKQFHGMQITDYATAESKFSDMIILVCFGTGIDTVLNNIKRLATKQELYVPDVPVYGDNLFDLSFAKAHKKELETVYNQLEDDASRLCFENTVLYKITGNADYLYRCETPKHKVFELLDIKSIHSFLDLGAYNGDTVKELVELGAVLEEIIAVEPDKRSFKKLCKATEAFPFITKVHACISDKNDTLHLTDSKGRGSAISPNGVAVNSVTVDSLLAEKRIDYIKYDVEGNELAAISGAKNTITKFKPKMRIAAYHRSEDIFTIPLAVLNLRDDYKVYMRHTPCLPAWDTDFIFI